MHPNDSGRDRRISHVFECPGQNPKRIRSSRYDVGMGYESERKGLWHDSCFRMSWLNELWKIPFYESSVLRYKPCIQMTMNGMDKWVMLRYATVGTDPKMFRCIIDKGWDEIWVMHSNDSGQYAWISYSSECHWRQNPKRKRSITGRGRNDDASECHWPNELLKIPFNQWETRGYRDKLYLHQPFTERVLNGFVTDDWKNRCAKLPNFIGGWILKGSV